MREQADRGERAPWSSRTLEGRSGGGAYGGSGVGAALTKFARFSSFAQRENNFSPLDEIRGCFSIEESKSKKMMR